ncbi:MAG: hypothetical protein GMKNLPBB_02124 [Myxococcota bacterium]|nr:hypothetical protein [Myxococcota bacterium]
MDIQPVLLAACLAAVLLLSWLNWILRARVVKLRATLDSVTRDMEHMQRSFHRFAPQDVVEDILHRGVATRGERRTVTIMFADLVGFTSLSEKTAPEVVVTVLNGYFQAVSQAISRHNGFVSKFMGDGLMALFGAPEPNPWQAMDGVRAALAMRDAVAEYNIQLRSKGLPEIGVSIGLHRGEVIAGVIGSSELVEYTVIGDVVNTAARIESLTRAHGADILISAAVRDGLDERFELEVRPPMAVKGKKEPVATWRVLSCKDGAPAS